MKKIVIYLFIGIISLSIFSTPAYAENPEARLREYCLKYTQDETLIETIVEQVNVRDHGLLALAVAIRESSLRPWVKNGRHYGMFQVSAIHFSQKEESRLKYHKTRDSLRSVCGVKDLNELYEPETAWCAGYYLIDWHYYDEGANVDAALQRYNASSIKELYARQVIAIYQDIIKYTGYPDRYDFKSERG